MPSPQDVVNQLRIASPCPATWAEMVGDDRARFCAACEKHVYDFSKMTAAEGLALIREKEGQVCARLWRRADGTVITADCAVGKRLSARRSVAGPLAAAALLAAALAQAACAPKVKMADAPGAPRKPNAPVPVAQVGFVGTPAASEPAAWGEGAVYRRDDAAKLPLR